MNDHPHRSGLIRSVHLQLYDMRGCCVVDEPQSLVPVTIQIPGLAPRMYICVIRAQDGEEYMYYGDEDVGRDLSILGIEVRV